MNSTNMWATRFIALIAVPSLMWTAICDPWWEQVLLGAIWALTLQVGPMTAYYSGTSLDQLDAEG